MKKLYFIAASISILVFVSIVISCDILGNGKDDEESTDMSFEIASHPGDPMILKVTTKENDEIWVGGEKNEKGDPLSITNIIITTHQDGETRISLDNQSRPVFVRAPNGVTFEFDWISNRKAALTAIEPTGGEQLNILFDLDYDGSNPANSILKSAPAKRSGKATLSATPIVETEQVELRASAATPAYSVTRKFYIKQCDVLVPGECWVDVKGSGGFAYKTTCYGYMVDKAVYEVKVPLPSGAGVINDISQVCDKIASLIGDYGCTISDQLGFGGKQALCLQLSVYSSAVTNVAALAIEAACASIAVAADVYCATLGNSGIPGGDSLSNILCKYGKWAGSVFDDEELYTYYPTIAGLQKNIVGTVQTASVLNNYNLDNFNVTLDGYPAILSLVLNPSNPLEGVSYRATARFSCLPPGSKIKMSVSGSDGYEDWEEFTVPENVANYETVLLVPGADEGGVKDVITVVVYSPDGKVLTQKTASLVFVSSGG